MNDNAFASFEELSQARIGVFGLGVTGRAACELIHACGGKPVVVNQQATSELSFEHTFYLQDDPQAAHALAECDIVLLSPGIARTHAVLDLVHEKKVPVWNEIELAFRLLNKKIEPLRWLAITGTNGKTTTVTLLGEMLKYDGRGVFIGGNIGTPLCELARQIFTGELAPEHYPATIVLELSSFQLESLETFRPHGCAILNISASHGERYERVRDYALAKAQIVKRLGPGDVFLSLQDDNWSEKLIKASNWRWERVNPSQLNFGEYNVSRFQPFGAHNLVNLAFAIRLAEVAGAKPGAIQVAIENFKGVSHRLENIYQDEYSLVLNDSKSTNWASTMAALKSVLNDEQWGQSQITLVIGGKCRGHHDIPEAETLELFEKANVKLCIFGEFAQLHGARMQELYQHNQVNIAVNFEDILDGWNGRGVLLFSPGFPSFDAFKSYSERGDRFGQLIRKI